MSGESRTFMSINESLTTIDYKFFFYSFSYADSVPNRNCCV